MANILVYVELVDDAASWASLLTLRQARQLATEVGATIYAVLPCASPPMYGENDIIAVLSRQGADKVILMTHEELQRPTLFASHGEALLTAANQFPPALLLVPDGPAAAEIAPRVSARLGGLFVRYPDLSVSDGSRLRIEQPLFEDTHVHRYDAAELEHSVVAVVSPDPQHFGRPLGTEEAEVVVISPGYAEDGLDRQLTPVEDGESGLRPARVLLVGPQVKTEDEARAIAALAEVLKAEVRRVEDAPDVVDAPTLEALPLFGYPELMVAVGVDGTAETLAALGRTSYLICVHPDREAPLFSRAQLGLVSPVQQAVEQLVAETKGLPKRPLLPEPERAEPPPPSDEEGMDESLRDTLQPSGECEPVRDATPTSKIEVGSANTVPVTPAEAARAAQAKTNVKDRPDTRLAEAGQDDPATQAPQSRKLKPIDQLAHTPPMGTPMTLELKKALAGESAPTENADDKAAGPTPTGPGADSTPDEADVASEKTPEANPAGVVKDTSDAALDDTVPAPQPGEDKEKPS